MPSIEDLKKKNKINIPKEQKIIQTPIIVKYMLLDPDIVTEMIIWNKQATEDINEIKITMKKDKQQMSNIMNEFIHQEEKYKVVNNEEER